MKRADFKLWPEIRAVLLAEIQPVETLQSALIKAGAPTRPEQIGWNAALVEDAIACAKTIRNRFTFLDLI